MKLRLPFRSRLLLGVLCAALIGLLAIPVFASIPGPGGLINGCFQKSTGKLRVIDPSSSRPSLRACHPDEVAIYWNQVGPAGPAGPPGPAGPQGATEPAAAHNRWLSLGLGRALRHLAKVHHHDDRDDRDDDGIEEERDNLGTRAKNLPHKG